MSAALGAAAKLADDLAPMRRIEGLRDHFWSALQARFDNSVALNGHPVHRLPNTLNVSFCRMRRIRDSGSSRQCRRVDRLGLSQWHYHAVAVLAGKGVAPEVGIGTIRFSLGGGTTEDEIASVIE
jgi:cysteine desulfurase